jgi:hypothetical protein
MTVGRIKHSRGSRGGTTEKIFSEGSQDGGSTHTDKWCWRTKKISGTVRCTECPEDPEFGRFLLLGTDPHTGTDIIESPFRGMKFVYEWSNKCECLNTLVRDYGGGPLDPDRQSMWGGGCSMEDERGHPHEGEIVREFNYTWEEEEFDCQADESFPLGYGEETQSLREEKCDLNESGEGVECVEITNRYDEGTVLKSEGTDDGANAADPPMGDMSDMEQFALEQCGVPCKEKSEERWVEDDSAPLLQGIGIHAKKKVITTYTECGPLTIGHTACLYDMMCCSTQEGGPGNSTSGRLALHLLKPFAEDLIPELDCDQEKNESDTEGPPSTGGG